MMSYDSNGTTVIAIVVIVVIIMKCLEAAVMVISMIGKKVTITLTRRAKEGDWKREICEESNMHKIKKKKKKICL